MDKDVATKTLIFGFKHELGRSTLKAANVNWISGSPTALNLRVQVKIRYRAELHWGILNATRDGGASVEFDEPLRDITPGQQAVFYDGEYVLGGGIIQP